MEGRMAKSVAYLTLVLLACLGASLFSQRSADLYSKEEALNIERVKWIYAEGVNKQNPDAWDEVLTEDYVRHCDAMPPGMQEMKGIETMKGFLKEHFAAFPDWHEEITQIMADGDMVAVVTIGTGTMTGAFGPFQPTGKSAEEMNVIMFRFEDGKIAESWITWDNLNFMNQLGLEIPYPSAPESGK